MKTLDVGTAYNLFHQSERWEHWKRVCLLGVGLSVMILASGVALVTTITHVGDGLLLVGVVAAIIFMAGGSMCDIRTERLRYRVREFCDKNEAAYPHCVLLCKSCHQNGYTLLARLAAIECNEAHMPGDCLLCGAGDREEAERE